MDYDQQCQKLYSELYKKHSDERMRMELMDIGLYRIVFQKKDKAFRIHKGFSYNFVFENIDNTIRRLN